MIIRVFPEPLGFHCFQFLNQAAARKWLRMFQRMGEGDGVLSAREHMTDAVHRTPLKVHLVEPENDSEHRSSAFRPFRARWSTTGWLYPRRVRMLRHVFARNASASLLISAAETRRSVRLNGGAPTESSPERLPCPEDSPPPRKTGRADSTTHLIPQRVQFVDGLELVS